MKRSGRVNFQVMMAFGKWVLSLPARMTVLLCSKLFFFLPENELETSSERFDVIKAISWTDIPISAKGRLKVINETAERQKYNNHYQSN